MGENTRDRASRGTGPEMRPERAFSRPGTARKRKGAKGLLVWDASRKFLPKDQDRTHTPLGVSCVPICADRPSPLALKEGKVTPWPSI